jgi:hypothetical protein|tara:strand:+ start:594 stop:1247 length:654 start_codon:yes stop_codon:yes gene_type:complete
MSEQLLTIETAFLGLPQVQNALGLTAIRGIQTEIQNASKSKFAGTMKMGQLILKSIEFFESEEGKELFAEEGIQWTKAELGLKVFGWQKSFFYKVIKASKLDARIVDAFKIKCEEVNEASISIANLLKFAKTIDLDSLEHSEDATSEEIEATENEAIESAEIESPVQDEPTILTFSFKNPAGKNIAVRVLASGEAITTNETDDVRSACQFLMATLQE